MLDVGTGTGVLAIAAARALRRPVLASDIDPRAVAIARENARLNRAPARDGRACRRARHAAVSRARRRSTSCSPTSCSAPLQRLATPMARLARARRARRAVRPADARRPTPRSPPTARKASRSNGASCSTAGRRWYCGAAADCNRLPLMFEAKFQTFDDAAESGGERAARRGAAHRAGAARAHRLRRAARRPPPERISARLGGAARLAHRLHRLGRRRDRADGARGAVRRRPLHLAGARAGRHVAVRDRASGRDAARPVDRAHAHARATRSATIRGCTPSRAPRSSPRPAPMPAPRSSPIEPNPIDALWKDRPAPPLGAVTLHDMRFAGEAAETKLAHDPARDRQAARPTRWSCPIRMRSPGPSTSAAPTSRTRRCRSPSRSSRARAGRRSIIDGRKLVERRAPPARRARRRARARRFRRATLAALGKAEQDRAARSGDRRRRAGAARSPARGGKVSKGPDPIALLKAVKNAVEIEGARAAHRRDGAAMARFLAWFDREAPQRQAHRDRRGRGAGKLPPRDRPAQGRVVPDHLRRRARTARSCTIASPARPTARSRRAICS